MGILVKIAANTIDIRAILDELSRLNCDSPITQGGIYVILTRRPGESILIGDKVVVEVLSIKGNQVCIGIAADKSIPVVREEIADRGPTQSPR